jgi:uncharacterized protein YoxC
MYIFVFSLLFIVACIFCFNFGKFVGLKKASETIDAVTKTFQNLLNLFTTHGERNTQLLLELSSKKDEVIATKDNIISSLTRETQGLRTALENIEDMEEDFNGEDDVEEEMIGVIAKDSATTHFISDTHSSVASVALDLHAQLKTVQNTLEGLKDDMPKASYELLKAIAQLPKKDIKDVN